MLDKEVLCLDEGDAFDSLAIKTSQEIVDVAVLLDVNERHRRMREEAFQKRSHLGIVVVFLDDFGDVGGKREFALPIVDGRHGDGCNGAGTNTVVPFLLSELLAVEKGIRRICF